MNRLLPSPLTSAGLLVLWLLLSRSFTPGQILLGILLAVAMPLLMLPLRPAAGPMRHPVVLTRLVFRVGGDVVLSALEVARGVIFSHRRLPRSAFVVIPLELRDEHALAALAMITAVIPGTVWSELAPDRSAVLMHVFDLADEADFIHQFKTRYEFPLKEVFE
ncbi:Potassium efflux system protein PhaE [gamma proteobacterium HdN1]|nr:Potassium efflux system protein PhaE [gamma proteobacterium HdN1]